MVGRVIADVGTMLHVVPNRQVSALFLLSFYLQIISGLEIHCTKSTDFPVSLKISPVMLTSHTTMLPRAKARHGHQLNSEDQTADVIQISTRFPQCPLSVPGPHNAFSSTSP